MFIEFVAKSYTTREDAGPLTVCVTKDKMTAIPLSLSLIPVELSPPSARGDNFSRIHTTLHMYWSKYQVYYAAVSVVIFYVESEDFRTDQVSLTLPPSSTIACTELDIIVDDSLHENAQHFDLTIELDSTQTHIDLGNIDRAEVTIIDDDGKLHSLQ